MDRLFLGTVLNEVRCLEDKVASLSILFTSVNFDYQQYISKIVAQIFLFEGY